MKVRMVRGPAFVRVEGQCQLLGMNVSGKAIPVRAGKALPFELGPNCILDITGGDSWDTDSSEAGTEMWTGLAEKVLSMCNDHLVVMIVGSSDSGKSTLVTYITNMAISRGINPCVVDGDIGQGDLAPPTAIGASLIQQQVTDLRDEVANYYEFIGSITPSGSERLVAERMKSLLGRTRRLSRLHIINTDGYIADGGVAYKAMLAQVLSPKLIVNLGAGNDLSAFARGKWFFIDAPSSNQATKTWLDRTGRRMDQFMRHVGEGSLNTPIGRIRFVYRARRISIARARRLFEPSMEGMFVGLGMHGIVKAFGVIQSINENLWIQTDAAHFDTVYLGDIALKGGKECRLMTWRA